MSSSHETFVNEKKKRWYWGGGAIVESKSPKFYLMKSLALKPPPPAVSSPERRCLFFFSLFFFLTLLFSSFWTSRGHRWCHPFSPPVLTFNFNRATGFAIPLCSSIFHRVSVANSRSRAFRKSICAQEKFPTNLHEYALGGARTHETDLSQART